MKTGGKAYHIQKKRKQIQDYRERTNEISHSGIYSCLQGFVSIKTYKSASDMSGEYTWTSIDKKEKGRLKYIII